ncbi:MAG: hypothetical protein WC299_09315 [Kiritimatiellia bacterium]
MAKHVKSMSLAVLIGCALASGCVAEEKKADSRAAENAPAPAIDQAAPVKNVFQPSAIDPALVRQSMQARSEYEEMNRKIMARTSKLYEENTEIKEMQAKMRELQKQIDALLAEDEELAGLKKKFQSIAPEIPSIPRKMPAAPPPADGKK